MSTQENMGRTLARGTLVNFLGIAIKSLHPVFYILATRVYGPEIFGVYLLANTLIEMTISLSFSGVQDGMLLFASRHVHEEKERGIMYRVAANALVIALVLTGLMILAMHTFGPSLIERQFNREGLVGTLGIMVLALPFIAIPQLVVSMTKSLMIMKYDALLLGAFKPAFLIGFAVILYFISPGLHSLAIAYLLGNIALSLVALWVYRKFFSFAELGHAFLHFRFFGPLFSFSIPQNLNLTLAYFMAGIGILFLGSAGYPSSTIAYYGTGAEIIRNLRQVRLGFSSVMTPVIARYWKEGRIEELSTHYGDVTRWIAMLAFPIALMLVALKQPLLLLFHASYTDSAHFMLILASGALVACLLGLATNVIVMTGHSKWNLYNGIATAVVSIVSNILLVPRWGIIGAAIATAIASAFSVIIKLVQCHFLLKIRLKLSAVYKPLVAGILAMAAFAALYMVLPYHTLWGALALGLFPVGLFVAILFRLGLEPSDIDAFRLFGKKRK